MVRGHTPPEASRLALGERMGRYRLLDHFASGGTSELYVALRDGAHEICLLKVLSAQLMSDARAAKRLQREAAVAFRLTHPNFAKLLSAGDEGGRFTLATEFIAGQNVGALIGRVVDLGTVFPIEVALGIAAQVLDGLEYLHEQTGDDGASLHLVHRDLTVANVIVGFAGEVKIIDLGAMHGKLDDFKTAPGVVLGTPQAMAPEQAVGDPVDRRTDVYAAGLMLYQMLTAHMPFVGETLFQTLDNVRSQSAPLATALRPEVGDALAQVIARALSKSPADRPATAAELKRLILEAAPVAPARGDVLARFATQLAPEEVQRMRDLADRGRLMGVDDAEFESEDTLQQGAFTRSGVPMPSDGPADESAVRTAVVRSRSSLAGAAPLAPVIPLPRRASRVEPGRGATSQPANRTALTPTVMEMPGTAVVKVSQTQLVRDTRALRGEVERWRYAFIAAVTAGLAGMVVVGVIAVRWSAPDAAKQAPALAPGSSGEPMAVTPSEVAPAAAEDRGAPARSPAPGAEPAEPAAPVLPERKPIASAKAAKAAPRAERPPASAEPTATASPPAPAPEAPAPAAPPAPAAKPDELGELQRMLAQLREQEPRDTKLFDALAARLRKAAQSTSDDRRRLILSDVAAAERSYDVESLADALQKLGR